jgi:hypothetical protein
MSEPLKAPVARKRGKTPRRAGRGGGKANSVFERMDDLWRSGRA